ncbi:amino acid/amide ABC transporter ATP-binding protein 1, HAAT family [Raineyella antarctica]|uniref:Amino acid/amide ABC transporter ATP-binding protein 1, HAAT family n=1 Tax=Raineyella antarctica TaxID=1577474 RepID=A0A1G6HPQ4_9ACTN|nr:ABC transporter ATP-binding protein [Raineyella antarctica]SDB96174.1 amino acid/amide ABC transporter ATP-binding protein 1, HAAT family [Raineyella antarctica]
MTVRAGTEAGPEAEPALHIDGVSVRIGGLQILKDVSLSVRTGEVLAVIGPNGAGKTTLFNCITGQQPLTGGRISSHGRVLTGHVPSRIVAMGVARTYQNLALFDSLSVRDNLLLGYHRAMRTTMLGAGLLPWRTRREEARYREKADTILASLGLEGVADRPVGELPLGICKRVELARAVAMDPKVLLMDEPAAGMNSEETEAFGRYIKDLHRDTGITVLVVEHDIPFVLALADRIAMLNFGELITQGSPDEVRTDPRVIEAYLGREAA